MLQEFFTMRDAGGGAMATLIALAGVLIGGVLWLFGSRFSRTLITLLGVTVGTQIGLRLPAWAGVPLSNWVTAIAGAAVIGVAGFVLHRFWIGVALSAILTSWVAIGVWSFYGVGASHQAPPTFAAATLVDQAKQIWSSLPSDIRRVGPLLCGTALLSGLAVGILWSRLAGYLMYSFLGVTRVAPMGMLAMELSRPQMLQMLPSSHSTQLCVMVGMAFFGAM